MRRILFTVLASAALCAAAPTVALAHNGHRNHHKRHHHARVRHEFFKAHRHDSSTTTTGTGTPPASTIEPTAGTVTGFANNVLMITLTDGSVVSGEVTNDTEIKCENPEMQNGDNDADDNGAGDEHGDAVFHHSDGGGDNGDRGDDNDNDEMCTPTPGMAVRSAELTINGTGAFWNEVELINTSSSTTSSPS
jgi:hypothetical protein